MSDLNPEVLKYNFDSDAIRAESSFSKPNPELKAEVDRLQAMVDTRDDAPCDDPMEEVLRLAKLTGGANATLGLASLPPESEVHLPRLEIARKAAYIAGLPKPQE